MSNKEIIEVSEKPNLGLPTFTSTVSNSLNWRLWHGINYMIGGVTFFFGSMMYYPDISAVVNGDLIGGWLFTIGSFCFLLADLTEWHHFKLGCLESTSTPNPDPSLFAKFRRVEVGLNFFCSAVGSLLYLIGSIFFIPATNMLYQGEVIFIYGSLIIFFSQMWKCLRTLFTDESNPGSYKFSLDNLKNDFSGFNVDLWAGIGGLMYAIGTYLFMSPDTLILAVDFFVFGGTSFSLSGGFMQYRYFYNKSCGKTVDTDKEEKREEKYGDIEKQDSVKLLDN